jgi:hypothetical protein
LAVRSAYSRHYYSFADFPSLNALKHSFEQLFEGRVPNLPERAICFSAKSGTHAGIPNLANKYCRPSRSAVWPTSMKALGWQVGHSAASIPEKREPIPD